MAFTKTMVNGDMQALHTAMLALVTAGIFNAVSLSEDERTITCTDADNNVMLTIAGQSGELTTKTITAYINGSTSKVISSAYIFPFITSGTGAYLPLWSGTSYANNLLIGKTNTGKPGIVISDYYSTGSYGMTFRVSPITWGAYKIGSLYYQHIAQDETQTFMHAIPGFPASPEPLYFPNLMAADLTQYTYNAQAAPYEVSDGTNAFYTNGLLFLKDGGAS